MTFELEALIREASRNVTRHGCPVHGHDWIDEGGRRCPMGAEGCSQTVYVCRSCGQYDYGGPAGPGEADCKAACGDSMMGWRNGPLDPDPDGGAVF